MKKRINIDLSEDAAKELNVIAAENNTVRKLMIEEKLEKIAADSLAKKNKRGSRKS